MTNNQPSLNYNMAGVNYAMLTQRAHAMPQGGMTDAARNYYTSVLRTISDLDKNNNKNQEIVSNAFGCTHHFEAFLHQSLAFLSHIEAIYRIRDGGLSPSYPIIILTDEANKEKLSPPLLIGIAARNMEFDFILLLLISVALLERVSVFASDVILGKECNFYNLRGKLSQSQDVRAEMIGASIDLALPLIDNVLITGSEKSLRNRLAHLSSVPELLNSVLTLHLLQEGRILVFDHDVAGFPLFATAHSINKAVPFIALSIISALVSHDTNCKIIPGAEVIQSPPFSLFEPEWVNPAIDRRRYENTSGPQITATFLKPASTLAEVRLENIDLDASVLAAIR